MHTYFRILSYTRPYGKFIPMYLVYTLLAIVFGLLNFTLLKPLFDVIFEQVAPESLEKFRQLPSFELSLDYA
ncbi:MAG: ABC transporter ATP-binding protein, partial [Bacteroidetes bacterium]|nr:ABC transporter ATP-binding protein [Bacteroidota bacterium]